LKLRTAEHLGDVGNGRTALVGIESANDGGVMRAVSLEDQIHHLVFAVSRGSGKRAGSQRSDRKGRRGDIGLDPATPR